MTKRMTLTTSCSLLSRLLLLMTRVSVIVIMSLRRRAGQQQVDTNTSSSMSRINFIQEDDLVVIIAELELEEEVIVRMIF